jgi:hypothetical protein
MQLRAVVPESASVLSGTVTVASRGVLPERRSLIRDRNRSKRLSFLRSRLALRAGGDDNPLARLAKFA